MSTPTNDGGPAFAIPGIATNWYATMQTGISIRDYFASQALAGMVSRAPVGAEFSFSDYAVQAYFFADAMLAAREGKQ
jgi:hypothetical protein